MARIPRSVRVAALVFGALVLLGVLGNALPQDDQDAHTPEAVETPTSSRLTAKAATRTPPIAAPSPTPASSPSPSPTPSAKKALRDLGQVIVDDSYDPMINGDMYSPYKTTLPGGRAIGSKAAFLKVRGKWTGSIVVLERERARHVSCHRWKDDVLPEMAKYIDPSEHIVYEVASSSRKNANNSLYLPDGEVILQVHRILDPDDGPNGSDRTFITLDTSEDDSGYSGEGSDMAEPDETPATKIRYEYSGDSRTVRFDVNMTLFDPGFMNDEGGGPVAVSGVISCKRFLKDPVDY